MSVADTQAQPLVRVIDAALVPDGGVAKLVVTGLPNAAAVAEAVAKAGGSAELIGPRLTAVTLPSRLVDAAGRAGGTELAEPLRAAVDLAVESWLHSPPDIITPAGSLPTSKRTVVMGILNVTPDSFSDGGSFPDTSSAVAHGMAMAEAGADLVDVGGESTRPGAGAVDSVIELERVIPVVRKLADEGLVVSIDTTKAEVARRAVDAGAAMVNDISAGALDSTMLGVVSRLRVPYIATHLRGEPRTMQKDPQYDDVVAEVFEQLQARLQECLSVGIGAGRILVDPGIGFGKTADHNLALMGALRQFRSLGRPIVVGASRKSFLGAITGAEDAGDRLEGSLAAAVMAADAGAAIVRVHDVAETARALQVAHAIRSGKVEDVR